MRASRSWPCAVTSSFCTSTVPTSPYVASWASAFDIWSLGTRTVSDADARPSPSLLSVRPSTRPDAASTQAVKRSATSRGSSTVTSTLPVVMTSRASRGATFGSASRRSLLGGGVPERAVAGVAGLGGRPTSAGGVVGGGGRE